VSDVTEEGYHPSVLVFLVSGTGSGVREVQGSQHQKKIYQLANKQPTTGNPNIPSSVALAKEIREEINAKVGDTDANVSDLFDDGVAVDDYDDDVSGEVADDNQQGQMVLERLPSAASSSVTGATTSIIGSRAKTRQNQVASAIEATSSSANASFSALLQQRQMAV